MKLERNDAEAVQAAVARLAARAKQHFSLDGLLNSWATFVGTVERGYEKSIYEYANDLSVRNLLHEVYSQVPEGAQRAIASSVEALDQRFDQATLEVDRAICPATTKQERPWCFRIPRRLVGELREDLEAEGIGAS